MLFLFLLGGGRGEPQHLFRHELRLLPFVHLAMDKVGEEEYFQHGKDDDELDEYHCPQGFAERHASESVVVEVVGLMEESYECFHLNLVMAANLTKKNDTSNGFL